MKDAKSEIVIAFTDRATKGPNGAGKEGDGQGEAQLHGNRAVGNADFAKPSFTPNGQGYVAWLLNPTQTSAQQGHKFIGLAGVLKLAQSVTDILYQFFPQSVDILRPEISFIYGEAPVLLKPNESAIEIIFGKTAKTGGKVVGFGAEQVILVRDDSAREGISRDVGNHALVLTILECKGLEFQDVLLYNFFSSSPLKNQWRVVYDFIEKKDLRDPCFPRCFPSFSHARHSILCSELKQLYVAITRTRQRLWICEDSEEFAAPMFDFWKKLGLVQVKEVGSTNVLLVIEFVVERLIL
ncbi:uncharacterized protein [Coffea arabica]|uniref:UvrD-like helicase C-terminal domain-containing protein n=1 Tax=Coffea arabica TaxID=13443 RepID=A0ABM4UFZ7_COFAR